MSAWELGSFLKDRLDVMDLRRQLCSERCCAGLKMVMVVRVTLNVMVVVHRLCRAGLR
jgi:hypothetical protein